VNKKERVGCTVLVHPTFGIVKTMKFYYVYAIESTGQDFIYTGVTKNLEKRLEEHNNGEELSTKAYTPFELIFYEAYRNKADAKRRETYLKSTNGKKALRTMLENYFEEN
jgi:putative endonuclease